MRYIDTYVHPDRKLGVIVEFKCNDYIAMRLPEFREYTQNIAMHIAALDPEKNVENYPVLALMDQGFVKDESITVHQYTKMFEKHLKIKMQILRYTRFGPQ